MAQAVISDTLEDAMARNPHLRRYIEQFRKKYGKMPEFHAQLSRDMKDIPYPNILYPSETQYSSTSIRTPPPPKSATLS